MNSNPRYLLLITGVPASGKSYLAHRLAVKFSASSINHRILSTDNLQAFLTHYKDFDLENIQKIFSSDKWDHQLRQFKLNKQSFDEKAWNISRKMAENYELLDVIFFNCQILIIQDQLPLKSQRKTFRKYACEKNVKFLQIQLQVTLEEAFQNNIKRGEQNEKQTVSNQVITKSFEKYESSPDALILQKQAVSEFLNQEDILSNFKAVQIQDNYTDFLNKKTMVHEYSQKEMDENELRKLISKIMKEEAVASEYFLAGLSSKEKAQILADCKKMYIQQKRKVSFKEIVKNFMLKGQGKKPNPQQHEIVHFKPQQTDDIK